MNPIQITTEPLDRLLELTDLAPQVFQLGRIPPAFLSANVTKAEICSGTEKRDPDNLAQHEDDESREHSAAV